MMIGGTTNTSLWCLPRYYESLTGLQETFSGTTKVKLIFILIQLSEMQMMGRNEHFFENTDKVS